MSVAAPDRTSTSVRAATSGDAAAAGPTTRGSAAV